MAFESAWAKLDRATEHRDGLDREINAFFEERSRVPRLGTKYEEESGDHVLYVTFMPDLGPLLQRSSLLFGDAVHNLRSALDHVAFEAASIHQWGDIQHPRRIAFPITDDADRWKRECNYRLSELHPDDVAAIRWYQPYEALIRAGQPSGARTLLGLLRDLDDWDKHRLLTAVAVPGAGLVDPHPQAMAIFMPTVLGLLAGPDPIPYVPVELGAVIARARLPDGVRLPDMEMAAHLSGRIHLVDGNVEVIETIDTIWSRVVEIIRKVQARY